MGECFTCEGAADERYTMILEADTVLDDVLMCEGCHDSYVEVPWIEIGGASAITGERSPCRVSEATD